MANFKYTAVRGGANWAVTTGAGSAIAGGEAIEINVDFTAMTQVEFINAIEAVKNQVISSAFPPA